MKNKRKMFCGVAFDANNKCQITILQLIEILHDLHHFNLTKLPE
jgi:hypothetical protein